MGNKVDSMTIATEKMPYKVGMRRMAAASTKLGHWVEEYHLIHLFYNRKSQYHNWKNTRQHQYK
jgi:hypothetical protein